MKRIVFHVGAPKTGSTSIQFALSDHNQFLISRGIYFPLTPSCKHPELAFFSSFNLFESYSAYAHYLPTNPDPSLDIRSYFCDTSLAYIQSFLSSDYHTLILSDELLPYYCNTRQKLHCLSLIFPEDVSIHFVYYTRSPADMYISLYSTLIKVNQTIIWPNQFSLPKDFSPSSAWIASPEMFDHSSFVSNVTDTFGVSSISVFSFPSILKTSLHPSPASHFFAFLGISDLAFVPRPLTNPRLDYISLFVLSFVNSISRSLSRHSHTHTFVVLFTKRILIPLLDRFSSFGLFPFPSESMLRKRSSFDKLFL